MNTDASLYFQLASVLCYKEATAGFEPAIGVLQTPALPLGYVANMTLTLHESTS
jgi:hypothetical protein